MNAPVSSAAAAVITLKVEPGVYRPLVARLISGAPGEQFTFVARRAIAPKWRSTRFGSYDGDEAITSTAPVLGSSATTAPQLSPSASSAACCAFESIVSTRLFPVTVAPFSVSSVRRSTVFRCEFDAVR